MRYTFFQSYDGKLSDAYPGSLQTSKMENFVTIFYDF